MSFRTRDAFLELGIEPDSGAVAFTPIRVSDLQAKVTIATSANNENRGTTNAAADEAEEGYLQVTCKRMLRGSGVVGTAPAEDVLLRAAQMEVVAITGVAATAATYSSVLGVPQLVWADLPATTMATGAVLTISTGVGAGERSTVTSWDAATKKATLSKPFEAVPDATSKYDILPQRVYAARPEADERLAANRWARNKADSAKSKKHALTGGMVTHQMSFSPGKACAVSYTMRGVLAGKPVLAPFPGAISWAPQAAVAPKLLSADLWWGYRNAGRMYSLSIDHAATLDQVPDVNEEFGFAEADATEHKTGGTFVYEMVGLDQDDPMGDFIAGASKWLVLIMGAPGNGFAVTGLTRTTNADEQDQRGRLANSVPFRFAEEDRWYTIAAF